MALDPAAANAVKAYRKLEDVFGDGRYAAGWSDKRVAKETGIAEAFIVAVRIEHFGEIKDPEIDAIRSEVVTLEEMLAALKARLAKVEAGRAK